ncbi:hypothetical protein EVG20_g8469 [Dentipellis fragilis]|uniref:glutathione transferase n=1 Tax=Dentipellis fragilis TaxID=205917 RepID=A0A4Y9Y873_9AGAM|nr:hypothetical protein EVG20_g8469 [Dentipellis fragilis]
MASETPQEQAPTAASGPTPAIIVHHLNDSRSQRILWLLEELEVPYEIKFYQRGSDLLAPKELLEVSPLGKAPVITDTDGNVNLAESGAIITYIIKKYGHGKALPSQSGELDDLYFTHYCEGSLMPLVVNKFIFSIIPERAPWFLRFFLRGIFGNLTSMLVDPQLKKHLDVIEAHLGKSGDWFAGGDEPTSADFMMSFALEALSARAPANVGPKTLEWVKRVHERPAYKRGLEKGGKYAYL